MGSPGADGRFPGRDVMASRVDLLMTSWYHDKVGPARCSSTLPSLTTATLYRRATMANPQGITIPIDLSRDEACAFAELLKRTSYEDCLRRSNRLKRCSDGREEADVMWSALRLVEHQFAEAGFAPRYGLSITLALLAFPAIPPLF